MDDLISRQAAIDALKEHRSIFCDGTPETFSVLPYGEKCRVDEIDNAIATLVNLPSAEPPIWAQEVERLYNKALCKPYIKKPFAWALYEAWKMYDKMEVEHE